jgi:uncharacterized protein YqeY
MLLLKLAISREIEIIETYLRLQHKEHRVKNLITILITEATSTAVTLTTTPTKQQQQQWYL